MSIAYTIQDQSKCYFLTLQVIDWIDIFSRKVYKDIVIENLAYCQRTKGLSIFAYVIMTNHIHILVRGENENLSGTIRDFKSYTAKKILEQITTGNESRQRWMLQIFKKAATSHQRNSDYQFWTHENHAEVIFLPEFLNQKLRYIHENPIRAGIVEKAEDYVYSSAVNYADRKGLLAVTIVTQTWKTY